MHKIKEILKKCNCDKVEVGTTETFQGREKRVIIISTVRARENLLLYDKKYNLGFVRQDKVSMVDLFTLFFLYHLNFYSDSMCV